MSQLEDLDREMSLLYGLVRLRVIRMQEESLNEIQFKLNEMTKIKENLKATNKFKPNVFLFNLEEACLFGTIELNQ